MLAAIDAGGTAVGVLADHLLRAATSKKFRDGLMNQRLALVSPFNPEAGFDVGNAMSRNRYIYCLADAAVVAATSHGSGGTWHGAVQNLREGWVPLWISRSIDANAGGGTLIEKGARWLPPNGFDVSRLLSLTQADATAVSVDNAVSGGKTPSQPELYALFLQRARELMSEQPATVAHICDRLDLHKSQVEAWLARAVSDGELDKVMTRPVRYALVDTSTNQPSLFS
jgi:predicted Rossmann fold nucleotide-binding protein DprA/Smf involved in DNA uptake